jgi:hypothetical protein
MRRTILFLLATTCGCWAEFPSDLLPDSAELPSDASQETAVDGEPDAQPSDGSLPDGTDAALDALLDTAPDTAPDTGSDAPLDGPIPDVTPDTAPDISPDTAPDTAPDGPIADASTDTTVDATPQSCAELFSATVPGFVLCQETATLCTVYFDAGAGSMKCSDICAATSCVGASDNVVGETCTASTADCEGKPCNCGAKMVDGLCNCGK